MRWDVPDVARDIVRDLVVVFTEDADWHTRTLRRALEREGLRVLVLSLNDCGFAIGETPHGLLLPGLDGRLPAAAFVRVIAKGTTEQITMRLGVLHALRELGVKVMNDARAIERCVDKSMTSFLIARAGLPTPRTFVREDPAAMQALIDSAPGDTVLKPLFGAQGKGLRRLGPRELLPDAAKVGGVYYLQEFVEGLQHDGLYQDWRVFVVGSRAVAAMVRRSERWITNIHQGADGEPASLEGPAAEMAVAATAAVGADYAGVDLIQEADGVFTVLEVNSMPAWKGLQKTTDTNVAAAMACHLVDCLQPAPAA
ncbi:RimK family alpha-L-glutamate ligase [Ancylobacter defluvii]|uniref:Lysine biosynthesis protein LysX n=1 Tax=Ancylobacter defluvii TaxID=1282440 RepID=A0A9W6JW46_9HYPH|nr:RimK family alpha-L-glutamate ligase [Ancylobacter defluvii]MBS7585972.1 RimK family alpha-L-glutamate ligase [Ancylobacter defluvii]GLK84352.1 lysine biosynthesis protein LysX [Ancylobacter defluvii]